MALQVLESVSNCTFANHLLDDDAQSVPQYRDSGVLETMILQAVNYEGDEKGSSIALKAEQSCVNLVALN
ncbi:hypothetical protein HBH56_174250 [Parastagonospora nodorum]|uniref:Uncharacterized protein n=1 Tax=Phaeosphaeria nodorum (strain SN15 / ATCC MYA-4574 / FGSC 10173) TaxID=321614 RepID=A0A7U2F0B4_PHANO|nr:hypothetical protein HBH56_174250 [Parastagonospora nodorum]QRC96371.1 hypothetical protein JI435_433520 [Parastagonospora nodorum SN15]KAH4007285.1 hypothetical protein HBI10_008270 [Parastagonospora nodorum]KAH4023551.1 hypothetical protein HBI13_089980 [Parastagonospora nodorum]KAH4082993.1 hypothetical protein HBH48_178080 [Parastagonospora nodorum]